MISKFTEFVKQNWIIFLLLPISILFFLFGPKLIASLFIDEGKPIKENIEIPNVIDDGQYRYSVDSIDIFNEDFDIYELYGWAFSTSNSEMSTNQYRTEIVLYNETGNFVFSITPVERKGVIETFSNLNINLQKPGYSVLINKNLIDLGDYCIGILLTNEKENLVQFIESNRILSNTPNTLSMVEVNAFVCDRNKPETRPILEDISLDQISSENKYSIDGINIFEHNGEIINLFGWAFSTSTPSEPTDIYKTEIILFSDTHNFLFEAKPVMREGVNNTFSDLGLDIRMPGFSAFINKETLPYSKYCVAIKLTHMSEQSVQFINTNKEIIIEDNEVILVENKNFECERIYQENMQLFTN
jgi:hypothetical protein